MMRALYGQAQALPASLFDLGISPHINASILITLVLLLPKDMLPFKWADRLREARKEGKGVSRAEAQAGAACGVQRTEGSATGLGVSCAGAVCRLLLKGSKGSFTLHVVHDCCWHAYGKASHCMLCMTAAGMRTAKLHTACCA
jgi:hypothetical protein